MSVLRPLAARLQRLVDRIDPHGGRYRMLFEASPLPMWVLDDETLRFLAVNDAALGVYGYTREEFLRMSLGDLRRPDERRDFIRNTPGGSIYRGVFRHQHKNGAPLDIDGIAHLVSWRGRKARLVVINDITERLRTQETLERMNRQLEMSRARQLSLSLRPPQLDDLGLAAALRSHLDRQARVAELSPHFDASDAPHELEPDTETACFRVAQEAINNVLRHAHAHNLWVRLFDSSGNLALSVRDDGRGFDVAAARERASGGASLGLVGMEERIALAGGSFELRAAPGEGTLVLATFPMRRRASEAA